MGHYARQCTEKKKKQHDVSTTTSKEIEFSEKFVRDCAFVTNLSVVTPSNIIWGDRVEGDQLNHIIESKGDQNQFP
jgi:hypothetical protein